MPLPINRSACAACWNVPLRSLPATRRKQALRFRSLLKDCSQNLTAWCWDISTTAGWRACWACWACSGKDNASSPTRHCALVAAALQYAEVQLGVQVVNLGVNTRNTAAIALYERMSFHTFGTERGYMIVDGVLQDEHYMGRSLLPA
jgi:hypothetical protein